MGNRNALEFFGTLASNNPNERSTKFYADGTNDFTDLDARFILSNTRPETTLLDVACGSGLILNKIVHNFKRIVAIDKFSEFTDCMACKDLIEVVHCDIQHFETQERFDVITLFGIMQYFTRSEATAIYTQYKKFLAPDGKFIIKNQFGVDGDVVVDGFSQELQKNYFSEYRSIEAEVQLLKSLGFNAVEVTDIYPPECNRWDNTHYFAIVAE